MLSGNKRIIGGIFALLLVYAGLEAGKKKHNDSKKPQQKSEDLNALMQQLKLRDEKRAQEDAHKKQAELKQQEEDKKLFPSREFLGSKYGESHKDYIKRLNQAIGICGLERKCIENGWLTVKCWEKRKDVLKLHALVADIEGSEKFINFEIKASSAEGIALLYRFKNVLFGIDEAFQGNLESLDISQANDLASIIKELDIYSQQSWISKDAINVALQLKYAISYYMTVIRESMIRKQKRELDKEPRTFDALHLVDAQKIDDTLSRFTQNVFTRLNELDGEEHIPDQELKKISTEFVEAASQLDMLSKNFEHERELITKLLAQEQEKHQEQQQLKVQTKAIKQQKQQERVVRKQQAQHEMAAHNASLLKQMSQENPAQGSLVVQQQKPMDFVQAVSKPALQQLPQLHKKTIIKKYNQETVCNWFSDQSKAIAREIALYPATNATPEQRMANCIAHTFPFEMDEYVECLAHKECLDDGAVFYRIPGSIINHATKTEETVEFGWGVDKYGKCFHRSATKRLYSRSSLADKTVVCIESVHAQQYDNDGISIVSPHLSINMTPFALHFKDDARNLVYKLAITKATV